MLDHGGNLQQAAACFGRPVEDWIDLSAGLNPHPYPAPAPTAADWYRLPEADPGLLSAACSYYGAPAMLAVAGTQAAIQALPALRAPSRVTVSAPSYAEHAYHWGQHGHTLRQVPYAGLAASVPDSDVLVVCNPNNPTGEIVAPALLLGWAAQLGARGGWLVVDEAFADTAPSISVAAACGTPGLIVLRSIGKFFGLAGARVGFVGAQQTLLTELAAYLGPWTVSGPAQRISKAALADRPWQQASATRLALESARLRALLQDNGITAQGTPLFQWWPEARPEAFHQHMAARGIWVRLFTHAARGIRLGLPPNDKAWAALAHALHDWTATS